MKAFVLAILLLSGCASIPNDTDGFMRARASTVHIQAKNKGVADGAGTGVVLNSNCVLTAAHVLQDETEFRIETDNGDYWFASMKDAIIDSDIDVGVLCRQDQMLNAPPVHIASKMPALYSRVFTIGYPLNYSKVMTEGRYMGNSLVTAQAGPGNSGGGVFSDDQYIGFCDTIAMYRAEYGVLGFPHLEGIVEIGQIRAFLDIHHIPYTSES